jgi:hypothetical protein
MGRNGKKELHPAVIISPDAEITQPEAHDPRKDGENRVAVLGISTQYRKFPDPYIALPYHVRNHAMTGLNRDCAVILKWYAAISIPDDCDFMAGDVPQQLMRTINGAVRADLIARLGKQIGTFAQLMERLRSRE